MGQPMQILPEQRANQGGRQPLQRSGLPLVTERGDVREGKSERMNSRGKEVWKYGTQKNNNEGSERMRNSSGTSVAAIPRVAFQSPARGDAVSLSLQLHVTSSPSMF